VCVLPFSARGLTDDEVTQHIHDVLLTIPVPAKVVVAHATPEQFRPLLIELLQLTVGLSLSESEPLAEFRAPERLVVCVNGIVRGSTQKAKSGNVFVGRKLMGNSLVQLEDDVSVENK